MSQSRVAVSEARGQYGNPKERDLSPLEIVTRRLVKTVADNTSVFV
jgi:hypothetical protein